MQDKNDESDVSRIVSESDQMEGNNNKFISTKGEGTNIPYTDDAIYPDVSISSIGDTHLKIEAEEQDHVSNDLYHKRQEDIEDAEVQDYTKKCDLEDGNVINHTENKDIFLTNNLKIDDQDNLKDTLRSKQNTKTQNESHEKEEFYSDSSAPPTPNLERDKNAINSGVINISRSDPSHLTDSSNANNISHQDVAIHEYVLESNNNFNMTQEVDGKHYVLTPRKESIDDDFLIEDDQDEPSAEASTVADVIQDCEEGSSFETDQFAVPSDQQDEQSFSNVQESNMNISMEKSTARVDSEIDALSSNPDSICNNSETASASDLQLSQLASKAAENYAPQDLIDNFMIQLERIHKEHETELQNMEKKHNIHMDELREELRNAEQKHSTSVASRHAVANHDKCLTQLRNLEKNFNQQLEQKDDLISKMSEEKIIMEQQIRELTKGNEDFHQTLDAKADLLVQIEAKNTELEEMTLKLKAVTMELSTSQGSYSTLKERVKVVASELKDRRVECRNLSISVNELNQVNSALESEVNDLKAKVSRLSAVISTKDNEIENLSDSIVNLGKELKKKEREILEKESSGQKSLLEYKKKAQTSLSDANARAAAAIQAREDAELDAVNARTEAANAIMKLEEVHTQTGLAVQTAQKEYDTMKVDMEVMRAKNTELLDQLSELKLRLQSVELTSAAIQKERDTLAEDYNKKVEKSRGVVATLDQKIRQHEIHNKELEDELAKVKEELKLRLTDELNAHDDRIHNDRNKQEGSCDQLDSSEADEAIYQLQQELSVSSEKIIQLKQALEKALSRESLTAGAISKNLDIDNMEITESSPRFYHHHSMSDSNPLLFAFEKQSELRIAREEIARLVDMIAETELSKSLAIEELENMRQKMNEAESRLRRYEKLGYANSNPLSGNINRIKNSSVMDPKTSSQDALVNLEYLKNIILRFMNSKTLNEKKALVPVIGAVLELTTDEQKTAMQSVEKSAGITGVSTSLIENVQSKGIAGLFG